MKIIDINGSPRECESVSPDKNFPGFLKINYKSKNRTGYAHNEWYPISDFVALNPNLAHLAKGARTLPSEDLGAVSQSGRNFLEDATKNWPVDVFKGTPVWISRGKGEGQQRTVAKNDRNKLYVDKVWIVKPDKSSQYVVSFNVQKNIKPMGNTLPGLETKQVLDKMIKKAKTSLIN